MGRFNRDEVRRYSRQILLREVGGHGQERLRQTPVRLWIGGLAGEVAARYLLRAGVVRLRLCSPGDAAAVARLQATLAEDAPGGAADASGGAADPPGGAADASGGAADPPGGAAAPRISAVGLPQGLPQGLSLAEVLDEDGAALDPPAWAACAGPRVEVGLCCPCASGIAAPDDGEGAWLAGSLLGLVVLERVLGLRPAPLLLRCDLSVAAIPGQVPVPGCRCAQPSSLAAALAAASAAALASYPGP